MAEHIFIVSEFESFDGSVIIEPDIVLNFFALNDGLGIIGFRELNGDRFFDVSVNGVFGRIGK